MSLTMAAPRFLLVTLLAVFWLQCVSAGPLSQINSLVKTKYGGSAGDSKPRKKVSLKQEREQLYEAYNLLHSLAQVSTS